MFELIGVAQDAAVWTETPPQRANFREWSEIICNAVVPGSSNRERRGALKGALDSAWTFSNWLTHAKSATWLDADMAHTLIQHAIGMATSLILRELRGVPEACPECGSPDLAPEQGERTAAPGVLWERPRCADCGWAGRPVLILDAENGRPLIIREGKETHDHSIMNVPLRAIRKPGDPAVVALQDAETGPPEPTEYFAYGSNMATARLRQRIPSATPLGVATLPGHELRFHKRSKDGSGKCNALATDDKESAVVGVLYSFDPSERQKLDAAAGAGTGYDAAMVTVVNHKGRRRKVLTYIASTDAIDESLRPYSWYKDHVLAGAKEHGLRQDYLDEHIAMIETVEDPVVARDSKERASRSA